MTMRAAAVLPHSSSSGYQAGYQRLLDWLIDALPPGGLLALPTTVLRATSKAIGQRFRFPSPRKISARQQDPSKTRGMEDPTTEVRGNCYGCGRWTWLTGRYCERCLGEDD